ncbi:hypothetical protein BE221DRAFT_207677 [Ostreococcus tauri]|uniref:Uncharacterized protein n=1 Tax=Ostreococcus tauri TaxID=70448 RepID=A0A1Y5I161_OSTTA|nr:hypothetical protein BE221DRAFT_207677 [Ostreococcus tauri]
MNASPNSLANSNNSPSYQSSLNPVASSLASMCALSSPPNTLMFISNTLTCASTSKSRCSITFRTERSNAVLFPNVAMASRASTSVTANPSELPNPFTPSHVIGRSSSRGYACVTYASSVEKNIDFTSSRISMISFRDRLAGILLGAPDAFEGTATVIKTATSAAKTRAPRRGMVGGPRAARSAVSSGTERGPSGADGSDESVRARKNHSLQ